MGNMSYCRFENTYQYLEECYEALQNEGGVKGIEEEASQYEKPYVKKLNYEYINTSSLYGLERFKGCNGR